MGPANYNPSQSQSQFPEFYANVPGPNRSDKRQRIQSQEPIKLFFHHDAAKFAELCGHLEDLSIDKTVAFIQKKDASYLFAIHRIAVI